MPNGGNNFDLGNETPEADAIDQHLSANANDQSGLDTIHLDTISHRDADEADLVGSSHDSAHPRRHSVVALNAVTQARN